MIKSALLLFLMMPPFPPYRMGLGHVGTAKIRNHGVTLAHEHFIFLCIPCSSSEKQMTPSDFEPAGGTVVSRNGFPEVRSCLQLSHVHYFLGIVLSSAPALPVI